MTEQEQETISSPISLKFESEDGPLQLAKDMTKDSF
jgi:hypothetical protein